MVNQSGFKFVGFIKIGMFRVIKIKCNIFVLSRFIQRQARVIFVTEFVSKKW